MKDSDEATYGGRLPLMTRSDMSPAQWELTKRIERGRSLHGEKVGYRTRTDDGRLLGPFNAFLRAPRIAAAYLAWAETNAASPLSQAVTEATVLAVGARWRAPYVVYAHVIGARAAGLSDEHIDTILRRDVPESADADVAASLLLTGALLDDHRVSDEVYDAVRAQFDEEATVALVSLIGQYVTTSAMLTCFDVPAPRAT